MKKKSSRSGEGGNSIFSGALNNINFLSGEVDPQTGLFSSVITFGTLFADRSFGPDFPLKMTFSPFGTLAETSSHDALLGKGWEMDLPSYNGAADTITLPGGKSYKIYNTSWAGEGTPWRISHLAKDILIFGENGSYDSKLITIRMKNGEEFLIYCPDQYAGYIQKYTAPDGRYFEFDIREVSGGIRLDEVTDNHGGTLVDFSYGDHETKITLSPGTASERKITLSTSGRDDSLSYFYIEDPDGEDIMTEFEYEFTDIGSGTDVCSINKIIHPSGAEETVEYFNKIYLPNDAPWDDFPAVSIHRIQYASGGPVIETEYELGVKTEIELGAGSQHNFFGNGLNINWEDATDSLANYNGEYTYSNVVTEDGTKQTTFTYNKFHELLIQEETYDGGVTKKTTYSEYYGDDSIPLEDQTDVRYELKKKETVSYSDSSGKVIDFITEYDHDDYGNELLEKLPDGTSTQNSYYPAAGEDGACPPHPFGLVAFVKETLTVPNNAQETAKKSTYTYQAQAKIPGGDPGNFVNVKSESYAGVIVNYSYYEDTSVPHYGMLKQKTTGKVGAASYLQYGYTLDSATATLTISQTLSSDIDSAVLSSSETKTWANDQTIGEVDEDQLSMQYTYDSIGRLKQETKAVGTPYEATRSWIYTAIKDMDTPDPEVGMIGWCIQEQNNASGSKIRTYYDHGKNEFFKFTCDDLGLYHKVSRIEYDALKRKTAEYRYDHELDAAGLVIQTFNQSMVSAYGTWGEVKKTTGFTGMESVKEVNPFTLQTTEYAQHPDSASVNLLPHRSTYNLFQEKEKVEVMSAIGEAATVVHSKTYGFDGFGRQTSQTSEEGKTITKNYDGFDRPVTVTYGDGTKTIVTYEGAGDELIQSIKVVDDLAVETEMGTKSYDGLGRLLSKTVNGATWNYDYDSAKGAGTKAWRVTNARKHSLLFEFIPGLNALQKSAASLVAGADFTSDKELENIFTYATKDTCDATHPNGSLKQASGDHGKYDYTYTPTGKVKTVTQNVNGKPTAKFDYQKVTLLGKPLKIQVTKDGGNPIDVVIAYDAFGRLLSTTQEGLVSQYSYDLLGRVSSLTVFDQATGIGTPLQTTAMKYDPYNGKESKRTVSAGDKVTVFDYLYYGDTMLKQRTTTITGTEAGTLVEKFTYESKGRLHVYEIATGYSSHLLPLNEHGQPFIRQEMVHNALDNLASLKIGFPNGDENTSTYIYSGTRLTAITNSLTTAGNPNAYPASVALTYDADGNLLTITSTDTSGATLDTSNLTYSPFNKVSGINGNAYSYDCFNRLLGAGDETYYYKEGDRFMDHTSGDEWVSYMNHGIVPVAEMNTGSKKVLSTDSGNTVFGVTVSGSTKHTTFSPHGVGSNTARTGFNGEYKDPLSGGYLLGNGNRLYLPHLGVFNTMDSKSPFSIGGVNSYQYCQGDPINFSDPSGEFGFLTFLISATIGVAVAAAAEGIRSGISGEKFNSKRFLMHAAFSVVTAGIGTALKTTKTGAKITASASKAISSAVKSTRATSAASRGAKKAGSAIAKTGKRAWASTKSAGKTGARKASGKGRSHKLHESPEKTKGAMVREQGAVGTMTDIETGKTFEFLSDRGDLLYEKPGKMDRFFEVSGQSYFSLASITFTLVSAVVKGFNDREDTEEEASDTQVEPVYAGESFAQYYGDDE